MCSCSHSCWLFNCSNLDITNTFYSSNNTITRITLYYKFLAFCTKYVQLSCITAENDLHVFDVWLLTSCKLTSVFLVTWTFLRGRIASMYQILCKYIHPLWSYHVMKFSIAVACLYNCKEYFFCILCMFSLYEHDKLHYLSSYVAYILLDSIVHYAVLNTRCPKSEPLLVFLTKTYH